MLRAGRRRIVDGMSRQSTEPKTLRRPVTHRAAAWTVANPTVPVLLIASVVQAYREAVVALAACVGTVLVILWDRRRWPRRTPVPPPRPAPLGWGLALALAVGILAFADLVGHLPRASVVASAALALPGLIAAALVLRSPRPDPSGPTKPTDPGASEPAPTRWRFGWMGVALAAAAIELAAFLSQADPQVGNPQRPTISAVVEPLLDSPTARTVAIVVWLAIGVWLIRRVRSWMRQAA